MGKLLVLPEQQKVYLIDGPPDLHISVENLQIKKLDNIPAYYKKIGIIHSEILASFELPERKALLPQIFFQVNKDFNEESVIRKYFITAFNMSKSKMLSLDCGFGVLRK